MANFLEVALQHAALGLHVFPVARNKSTLTDHGFKDATVDPEKIQTWWAMSPSANPGFAPGASGVAVLDIDHGLTDLESFIAWRDRNGIPATYTVRSGSRPEFKVHMYFKGAMRDVGIWELDGCSGQVKSLGGYVLAAGSEALHGEKHDKPGAPYEAIDGVLGIFALTPDVVRQLQKPAVTQSNNSKVPKTAWSLPVHEGENRTGFLMEQTGAMRNLGCGRDAILARMVELNDDPEIIADPVSMERLETTAANCAKYPVPAPDPIPVFNGGAARVEPDEFEAVETTARPVYPDDVWNGTPYGDFADYCAAGNFIPKRFFSESLRTVAGSVVGGQLSTDYQGVNARAYTVLIGPPGSGKGTAITAARRLVEGDFDSQTRSSERPLLWDDNHDPRNWCWPSRYIGAHVVSPASAPGLIQATKPHKLEKGETRNSLEVWRWLPRFITIQEEIGGLFANFANENSGRGLETAILELYDRDSFTTTATNERSAKSGRLLYSILGGIPKTEWDNIFARASSVGSGLFSRLNIIGTENDRTVAALPEYDFGEMQRVFLPRISALERTPARIPVSPNGRELLNEWFVRMSEELKNEDIPAARLNTHALRVALHLAWLRGHANVLESDVDAGIKVADFQAKMRAYYRPTEGETREAQWESRIMKIMRAKRSITYRELQQTANAPRAGTGVWERAIAGLKRDGRIAVVEEVTEAGRKAKVVKLLKQK